MDDNQTMLANAPQKKIKTNERVDDLQLQGLKVIQNPEFFCFGIDAVLLANFATFRRGARVAEFCAGNAVISILLTAKQSPEHILAVEMQPELADLAKRSVKLNALGDVIEVRCADVLDLVPGIQHAGVAKEGEAKEGEEKEGEAKEGESRDPEDNSSWIAEASLDAIVINPPYVRKGSGLSCSNHQKHVARQETTCGIDDFLSVSARCLKKGGDLFMVHRPDRLVDIFWAARRNGLEPKELTLVHPQVGKPANIALIRFRHGAGAELKMGAPIYVYDEAGRLQYAGGALYAPEKEQDRDRMPGLAADEEPGPTAGKGGDRC